MAQRPSSLYPTIGENTYPTVDHAYSSSFPGGASPAVPPSPFGSGGASSSGQQPPSPSSFSTLRVVIAEPYRIPPPVRPPPLPPQRSTAPGASSSISFDYERRVIAELEGGADGGGEAAAGAAAGRRGGRVDPYEAALGRYTEMGYSREEVAMAFVIAAGVGDAPGGGAGAGGGGGEEEDGEAVVEAARQYRELASMGFKADRVVGALILHGGDLAAATEACLAAASASP